MSPEINHEKISEILTTIAKESGVALSVSLSDAPWHICVMTSSLGMISSIIAEKEGSPGKFKMYAVLEHGRPSCQLKDGCIICTSGQHYQQLNPTKSVRRHKILQPLIQALYTELIPCARQGEIIIEPHSKIS